RVVVEACRCGRDAVIVGVGGGKVLDVAKMVAARIRRPFVSVPTVISHDGICSPIAVLRDDDGKSHSLGAVMPHGLIGDLDVIARSPVRARRAGVGDLVSNLSALSDWRLAEKSGKGEIDDFAYLLSNTAALSVVKSEKKDIDNRVFLREIMNGLVLSGIAMEIAGTSRPCSGGEHEFSHALDDIGSPALHGEQVAVGTLLCAYLRGEEWQSYKEVFELVGLPVSASGLGVSSETVVRALVEAPKTRPDRYTILEHVQTDEKRAREAAQATGVI
ncbi:MAG: iron-containing alcohol dehydrogenase family protein, partial [bacterium]